MNQYCSIDILLAPPPLPSPNQTHYKRCSWPTNCMFYSSRTVQYYS